MILPTFPQTWSTLKKEQQYFLIFSFPTIQFLSILLPPNLFLPLPSPPLPLKLRMKIQIAQDQYQVQFEEEVIIGIATELVTFFIGFGMFHPLNFGKVWPCSWCALVFIVVLIWLASLLVFFVQLVCSSSFVGGSWLFSLCGLMFVLGKIESLTWIWAGYSTIFARVSAEICMYFTAELLLQSAFTGLDALWARDGSAWNLLES